MSANYYRYNTIWAAPTFPAWDTYWPGYDGCGNRHLYYTTTTPTQPPAPGSVKVYEPEVVDRWKRGDRVSGRTNSQPPYRFTTYSVGVKKTRQHLVRRDYGCNGQNRYFQYGTVPKIASTCTPTISYVTSSGPVYSTYYELTRDFPGALTYYKSAFAPGDIQTALYEVQNEVIADASSSYDLLTDVAEMKDVPRTISNVSTGLYQTLRSLVSRHGRDVLKSARSLTPRQLLRHPSRWLKLFGEEWMTYRYGIMPLVYSYRDLMKTMDRGSSVKTRKCRTVQATETNATLPSNTSTYFLCEDLGSITVRGEVFQHFTSDEIARLSGFGFNPLVTAWELIPYSFVFDWFVNVGTYVAARTCQTWAQTRWACLSRRETYTNMTWVHLPNQDQTITVTSMKPVGWWGSDPPSSPNVVFRNPEGLYPYNSVEVDSYTRWVIPVSAVPLRFTPSLNWRRYVDASVMSLNLLGRLIRSLR